MKTFRYIAIMFIVYEFTPSTIKIVRSNSTSEIDKKIKDYEREGLKLKCLLENGQVIKGKL